MRGAIIKKIYFFCGVICGAILPFTAFAAMSSTNYYIYSDSIGVGGGFATSAQFVVVDSVGDAVAGQSTSTSYVLRGGYVGSENGSITVAVASSSLNLGTLATNAVKTAATAVTVSTDALTGYTLTINSVAGSMPSAVNDGTVNAGFEEYGFSASGANAAVNGDVAVAPGRVVARASGPVVNDVTTLTFKAAISDVSAAGTYSQTIGLIAAANL